jgi:heme exporter protein CcmD
MMDFGKNTAFILASYGASILVLGALVVHTLRKPRK